MKKNILISLLIFAAVIETFAQQISIVPLNFNTKADEFAPVVTQNATRIYFSSDRYRGQKVYSIKKIDGDWTAPELLPGDINDSKQSGSIAITPDGQYIIFAAYDHDAKSEGRTDLYSARKVNGKWVEITNLGPSVNSDYWDSQPTLTSDGNTLFFVSDRPGGQGGTDIYMSKRTREGWSKAENIGSPINSSSDEMSPLISLDDKTFTFASNKIGGMGGFDIYFTKYSKNSFSSPKSAPSPINTEADELFYYSVPNTDRAYFSSSRPGGQGELDVYYALPNPHPADAVVYVSGFVKDANTSEPLGAKITITDLKSKQKVTTLYSDDETGQYYVVLQPGRSYSVTASKDGYLFYSERFDIPANEKGKDIDKNIFLSKTDTRLLIFFDFNKTDLKDESVPELDRLAEYLADNSNIDIRLEGHTDDVGTDEYNDKLSTDRANEIKKYLVDKGISTGRITAKGFGKRQPLINEKTDEARTTNRRVELKIIKK